MKGSFRIRVRKGDLEVEVEGPEKDQVRLLVGEYLATLSGTSTLANALPPKSRRNAPRTDAPVGPAKKPRHKPDRYPSIVPDLNLKPENKRSLVDFVADKKPRNHQETIPVFVYYLRNIANVSAVSDNHIYTCYRNCPGLKSPKAFRGYLRVVSGRTGYIDTANMADIRITPHGENLVEHDLPAKTDNEGKT